MFPEHYAFAAFGAVRGGAPSQRNSFYTHHTQRISKNVICYDAQNIPQVVISSGFASGQKQKQAAPRVPTVASLRPIAAAVLSPHPWTSPTWTMAAT